MAVVLRSLALLALAGASIALWVQEQIGTWLDGFIRDNSLTLAERQRLLVGVVGGAAVGVVVGLIARARRRRLAQLAAPLILLGFVPPLIAAGAWPNLLKLTVVLAGFLLVAERLFRMALAAADEQAPARDPATARGRWARLAAAVREGAAAIRGTLARSRWARRGPAIAVVAGAIGYAVYMSVFALRMHGRFQTYNFDLGQFDNLFYNALHGRPLRCTILGFDHNWEDLRNHADLVTFFLLPFYAIRPGAPVLLVIQAAALGLGAIPLYRFSARRLPRATAAAIAFAYLLYPPTHGLQFFDIHFQPIAALFVLLVIDFVDERRYVPCAIAFVIALSCREDIPVGLAILGAFLALSGRRVWPGLIMAAAATAYFVAMRFFIMPSFGQWGFETTYKDLFPPGAPSFSGVIQTMLSNPLFTLGTLLTAEKLRYALQILLPLAFLPVRRPWLVASVVPGAMFTVLTTDYPPTIDISFQYSGHFLPYVFPATALALAAYGAGAAGLVRRRAALATLAAGTALCGALWGAIPPRDTVRGGFSTMPMRAPTPEERQKHADLVELHKLVPKHASLAMSNAEMTHVSHLVMRTLWDNNTADYLLYGTDAGDAHYGTKSLSSGEYEEIARRARVILLKRKTPAPKP